MVPSGMSRRSAGAPISDFRVKVVKQTDVDRYEKNFPDPFTRMLPRRVAQSDKDQFPAVMMSTLNGWELTWDRRKTVPASRFAFPVVGSSASALIESSSRMKGRDRQIFITLVCLINELFRKK